MPLSTEPLSRAEALAAIPDSPATIEFRAIALDPRGAVYRSGAGLLLVHPHDRMVGAAGSVQSGDVDELYRCRGLACELVADRTARDQLQDRYRFERATIWSLARAWQSPATHVADLVIRPLEPADALGHVSDELREEIEHSRQFCPVMVGFVCRSAVSFAYACTTERLGDISIDTLAEHRNRGIGAAVAAALVDHLVAEGIGPVWGAVVSNHASLRVAAKLGFTRPAGELFVCETPNQP